MLNERNYIHHFILRLWELLGFHLQRFRYGKKLRFLRFRFRNSDSVAFKTVSNLKLFVLEYGCRIFLKKELNRIVLKRLNRPDIQYFRVTRSQGVTEQHNHPLMFLSKFVALVIISGNTFIDISDSRKFTFKPPFCHSTVTLVTRMEIMDEKTNTKPNGTNNKCKKWRRGERQGWYLTDWTQDDWEKRWNSVVAWGFFFTSEIHLGQSL